jgi:phenylalanyl-tRNA synthetase alpha chain
MEEKLIHIKNNAISLILETKSVNELEEIKIQFLGRNGEVTQLLKSLPKIAKEERPKIGSLVNETKRIIEDAIKTKKQTFTKTSFSIRAYLDRPLDVTEPGIHPPLGHLHLVTQAIREITAIFAQIGFKRVRYPEIEWDWYAFTALNFPENHPARDDWETFFIKQNADSQKGPVVLTPHTSSGQIREMERGELPIKMLNIAKTYRRQSDVSHTPMFHQFEGLVVGEKVAISDLKGTLNYFVKSYFGENRVSRIRPYHFQFTEPSFEVDITCGVCLGKGCRLCKEGWLELGGAGMVHPNVLKACKVDPEKYTGFAFGWGVERVLMMKDGIKIDDLRILYNNDLDFLKQF